VSGVARCVLTEGILAATCTGIHDALAYYIVLKNAGVPTEMHLYVHGGHAFGLRKAKVPITDWPRLVDVWLKTIGMVA